MDLTLIKQLFEQEQYEEIIRSVNARSHASLLEVKGYAFQKLGRFEEALEIWNLLITNDRNHASYYNERGVCKFQLGFRHVLDDFNNAIALEPESPYFYSCRAYIKDKTGDTEGAVEDYTKAHNLDTDDAITLNNLGLAEQKLGHTRSARNFFMKSDDLLGIKTIDSVNDERVEIKPVAPSMRQKWKEVGKMLSSFSDFKKFLRELRKGSAE